MPYKLPTTLKGWLFDNCPPVEGVLKAILREPVQPASTARDETIYEYCSRRLGPQITDNAVSALAHGIYAGDIRELSVRSTFNFLWELEKKHGSITRGLLKPPDFTLVEHLVEDQPAIDFVKSVKMGAMFSFKNGMQTLTDALARDLEGRENVEILRATVTGLEFGNEDVTVCVFLDFLLVLQFRDWLFSFFFFCFLLELLTPTSRSKQTKNNPSTQTTSFLHFHLKSSLPSSPQLPKPPPTSSPKPPPSPSPW